MLDVCLLGTGGMMPLPRRYLTSLLTRLNGVSLLIDCGEGTQMALKKKSLTPNAIDIICITHFHADHISGLPGMLLSMAHAEKTTPLTIIGPKGIQYVARGLCVIVPELPFEVRFIEIETKKDFVSLGGYNITIFKVEHNVPCYGYCLEVPRAGKFDLEAAKKLPIPVNCWGMLQRGETVKYEGKTYKPKMVMGPDRKGLKVVYTTDSRPTDTIISYAKGADLFVCEGMYGEPGSEEKAKKKKHMTFYEAATMASIAQPKEMWLTHFSPSLADPRPYIEDTRKIFENTHLGKDGKFITLDFEEEEQ